MLVVHIQCLLRVDGGILASVSLTAASKLRNETKRNESHTHKFTTSAQAHHSTGIFSCAIWLAPGLDSVSEVRLMLFCVYSLLWQLSILLLTVLESFIQPVHADSCHLQ